MRFFIDYCQTQWRTAGMGGFIGLDYTAVIAAIQFEEPDKELAKELFEQVRGIERGALEELSEQAKRSQKK